MEKRNRLPNFSAYEENYLVSLAEEHTHIIENKKTDAVAWDEKRKVWDKIALEFEVRYGIKRGPKNLKEKYDNLKRMTKKNLAEERKQIYKTGGGQYTKNTNTNVERLAALMGRSATGFANDVNSDAIIASGPALFLDNLDESVESAIMEDSTQAPEELENINLAKNSATWSSWNPAQLKKKRSEKLSPKCAEGTIKSTNNPQHIFYEKEEKRSEEKHSWEAERHKREAENHNWEVDRHHWEAERHNWEAERHNSESEKHSWDKTHASLKTQILELELELKLQMQ